MCLLTTIREATKNYQKIIQLFIIITKNETLVFIMIFCFHKKKKKLIALKHPHLNIKISGKLRFSVKKCTYVECLFLN